MPSNEIENLSINVTSNANQAIAAIKNMTSAVSGLYNTSKGASKGMQALVSETKKSAAGLQDTADSAKDAAKETKSYGKEAENAGKSAHKGASGIGKFVDALKRITYYRMIRGIIRSITKAMSEGVGNLYQWSKLVDHTFANSMDQLATSTQYLKNSFAAMAAPLIQAVIPAIDLIIDGFVTAMNAVNMLFATIAGQKTYTVAKKVAAVWDDSADKVSKSTKKTKDNVKKTADEIKRTILGFDEINKLVKETDPTSALTGSSGTGASAGKTNYGIMFEQKKLTGGFKGFSDAVQKAMKDTISKIGMFLAGATLVLGAVLTFSGANIPLGLALMAAGISGYVASVSWAIMGDNVDAQLKRILGLVSMASVAIGAVLMLTGANVPLGIGMVAAGTVGTFASINWGFLNEEMQKTMEQITQAVLLASVAVGAILALSSANVPLGIGLMIGGITGSMVSLNWGGGIVSSIRNVLNNIDAILGAGEFALGAVLAFSGINVPVGIAFMAHGILTVGNSLNWGGLITGPLQNVLNTIGTILDAAMLGVGAVLTFTSVNVPVGLMLMAKGITGVGKSINWGAGLTGPLEGVLNNIMTIVGAAELGIGGVLVFTCANIPIGLALMLDGLKNTVKGTSVVWGTLISTNLENVLDNLTTIISGAELVIGAILAFTGVAMPLGITLMVMGAAGLARAVALNWNSIYEKIDTAINDVGFLAAASAGLVAIGLMLCLSGIAIPFGIALLVTGMAGLGYSAVKSGAIQDAIDYISGQLKTIGENFQTWWGNTKRWWTEKGNNLLKVATEFKKGASELWSELSTAWNKYVMGRSLSVDCKVNFDYGELPSGFTWYGGGGGFASGGYIYGNGRMGRFINDYAGGTTNAHGTLFRAGEAGPEVVGHIGGRTEVLNQSQLAATMYNAVRSAMSGLTIDMSFGTGAYANGEDDSYMIAEYVRSGVADATYQQNELLKQQNEILRQLLDKPVTAEISTNAIVQGLQRKNRRDGTTVVPVY